jgi:MATE family multidrug resistance protein
MLALALPGGILMLCEWWGWETNLFFAGLLCGDAAAGCVQLDTFPIVANTMVIGFMPAYGFNITAGALIGNALGGNDAVSARRLSRVVLCLAALISSSISVTLIAVRRNWGMLFSQDEEIVDLTARAMPVIAAYILLDCLGPGALVSIFRSMNIVKLPAVINFAAFYVFGIPFGLFLTFGMPDQDWGIIGLWSGLVLGMFLMVSSLSLYLFFFVDWHIVAEAAQRQAGGTAKDSNALTSFSKENFDTSTSPTDSTAGKKSKLAPSRVLPKAHLKLQRSIIGKKSSYKLVVDPSTADKGKLGKDDPFSAEVIPGAVGA